MSRAYNIIKEFLISESIDTFSAIRANTLCVINERRMPKDTKSAVMFLMPYYTGEHGDKNISLYSVCPDYHLYTKQLQEKFTGDTIHSFCFFADTSPIDERRAAITASLGFIGQNGLLINEKYGSYIFIGTLLTNAEFDGDEYSFCGEKKSCMGCGLCRESCAFLRGDSDCCLSELNQRKNVTAEELEIIRSQKTLWGCDICQEVCPHNKNLSHTPIEFFRQNLIERLDVNMLENMSEDEFSKRAYAWRGRKTILRNLGTN